MPKPAYLLDTNIVSDLVRRPAGSIRDCIAARGEERVCTSIVVAAELRFGAAKKGSQRLTAQLKTVLTALDILPFDEPADRRYGEIRAALERAGTPIGTNDLLIAAHALAHGLILVTANEDEFRRVPGLVVENWLNHEGR
ncbi:type II toxin-antitoxin system VapC family toxin [Candidatus Thiodictyon syntrophicum]|jgi:tRNA(fMet)-specific endonuclease VapC|uniref:Ribonuclease VapC n=1 Tax=Candidatus Thiodictyon syntrophicum TaxID=1166950 RepID=A0A2K8U202_9GAMM|nr:type II toxin-antitoxin system VapC family toxin [Candidatus Thiodictyon syntrophicum]AUB79610.1 VapC toxin family PIN domain ribonuclease [Candidatus Thiodictyon syntrophicum]